MSKMDDDVDMLIPEQRSEVQRAAVPVHYENPDEISKVFFKLGITQIVLGILLIGGGIPVVAGTYMDPDTYGQGIWGGIFVVICGSLAISARYHLNWGVVIASFIFNLLACLLLATGIVFSAISTFMHVGDPFHLELVPAFMAIGCGLVACFVISIYLCIVFGKVLNEKKKRRFYCCFRTGTSLNQNYGGYTMVYVPPGAQQAYPQAPGAFMAVPANHAVQVKQP